jgi:hypothetical protein
MRSRTILEEEEEEEEEANSEKVTLLSIQHTVYKVIIAH